MKTKIFALLMALVMVCGAFAGCQTEKTDGSQEESSADETTKAEGTDAREVLVSSVDARLLSAVKSFDTQSKYYNVKGTYATTDINGNAITAEYDYNKMSESGSSSGEFTIKTGEESFNSKFMSDGKDKYFTSPLLGEKPVMNFADGSLFEEDAFLSLIGLDSLISKYEEEDTDGLSEGVKCYWDHLKEGKLDSLFTKSKGDITIRNYQFKDVEIITFELTDEKAKEAIGADYDKKLDNVDIELKAEFVIENEEMSAIKANGKAEYEGKAFVITLENSANGTDGNLTASENGVDVFSLKLTHNNVEDNINGKLEITGHTETEDEEAGNSIQDSTLTVNYKNGKGDAEIKVVTKFEESGDAGIAVPYATAEMTTTETNTSFEFNYGKDENGAYYLGITKVETSILGIAITLDANIKYSVKPLENGIEVGIHSEINIMGMSQNEDKTFVITGIDAFEAEKPAEFDYIWDVEDDISISLYQSNPIIAEYLGFVNPDDMWDDIFSDYIVINDGNNYYSLDLTENYGSYQTEFTVTENTNNGEKVVCTLADGTVIELSYENVVWDDNNEIGTVTIDGIEFEMYNVPADEYDDAYISISCYNDNASVAIYYYPDTQTGDVYADFSFVSNGDTYMFSYLNGIVEKTILQDEETGSYYFAE